MIIYAALLACSYLHTALGKKKTQNPTKQDGAWLIAKTLELIVSLVRTVWCE